MGITDPSALARATHTQLEVSGSVYPLHQNTRCFQQRKGNVTWQGESLAQASVGKQN